MWYMNLCNLSGEAVAPVLNASERNAMISMGRPSTASFNVRMDNPVVPFLYKEDTLLQLWRDGESERELEFYGPVVSAELANSDDGTGMSVTVNAADPAWRLSKRIGQTKITPIESFPGADKGETAKILIDRANAVNATGIRAGTKVFKSSSTGTYTLERYKYTLSMINDLANGSDGFDWRIVPLANNGKTIGDWEALPVMGVTRENTVFEYGTGKKNVRKLSYLRDLGNVANKAYHPPEDFEETGVTVVSKESAASITERGLYETIAEAPGLIDLGLREKWCQDNIDARNESRKVLALTLDIDDAGARVPTYKTDYFLGDFVPARGVFNNVTIFNGKVRIYQIGIAINDAGSATITPILLDDNSEL